MEKDQFSILDRSTHVIPVISTYLPIYLSNVPSIFSPIRTIISLNSQLDWFKDRCIILNLRLNMQIIEINNYISKLESDRKINQTLLRNAICDSGELGNVRIESVAIGINRIASKFQKSIQIVN